jgi:transcriptional regulator with XRE-family HTH domain
MSVNERFKKVRLLLKLTQKDFADKLKTGQSTIADIEKGRIYPNPGIIDGIHEIFDIDLNWLISGRGKMRRSSETKIEEPEIAYGNFEIKDKYIHILEENLKLHKENSELIKKMAWFEANCDCREKKQLGSNTA